VLSAASIDSGFSSSLFSISASATPGLSSHISNKTSPFSLSDLYKEALSPKRNSTIYMNDNIPNNNNLNNNTESTDDTLTLPYNPLLLDDEDGLNNNFNNSNNNNNRRINVHENG
jgi:hypothetical protein